MPANYEYEREIQKIYIAYYGRAADPEGQQFWAAELQAASGDLSSLVDAFGNSAEFEQQYGAMENSVLINNLYQQLFGRDADTEGMSFYLELLESGAKTLASISLDILNGAQGDDLSIIDNKVSYAEQFTLSITVENKVYGEQEIPTVKQVMGAVSGDQESLNDAVSSLNTMIDGFDAAGTSYFGDSDAPLVFGGEELIEVSDAGETNIVLSDVAEIVSILNPEAEVNVFDFSPDDRVVLPVSLLTNGSQETTSSVSGQDFTDLLVSGGADENFASDLEAFLTASEDHAIEIMIERKTSDIFSMTVSIYMGDGSVQLFDLLVDSQTLENLGLDPSAADEASFALFSDDESPDEIRGGPNNLNSAISGFPA